MSTAERVAAPAGGGYGGELELPPEIQDLQAQVQAGTLTMDEAYAQADAMGYDTAGHDSDGDDEDADWDASAADGTLADFDDEDDEDDDYSQG